MHKTKNNNRQVINPPIYEKNIKNILLLIIPTSFFSTFVNRLTVPESLNSKDFVLLNFISFILNIVFLLFTFLFTLFLNAAKNFSFKRP